MKLLKKNNFLLGFAIGLLTPFPVYSFFWLLDVAMKNTGIWHGLSQPENIYLLSMAGNLILVRTYFVKLKLEKTAKGILLITLALMLLFFYLFYKP